MSRQEARRAISEGLSDADALHGLEREVQQYRCEAEAIAQGLDPTEHCSCATSPASSRWTRPASTPASLIHGDAIDSATQLNDG